MLYHDACEGVDPRGIAPPVRVWRRLNIARDGASDRCVHLQEFAEEWRTPVGVVKQRRLERAVRVVDNGVADDENVAFRIESDASLADEFTVDDVAGDGDFSSATRCFDDADRGRLCAEELPVHPVSVARGADVVQTAGRDEPARKVIDPLGVARSQPP